MKVKVLSTPVMKCRKIKKGVDYREALGQE